MTCILASALATKVSWEVPFEVVEASQLGPSDWSALHWVLRAPPGDHRHHQFLADTKEVGRVAVHLASARGGLLVGSVIAADEDARPSEVMAVAHEIVTAEARSSGSTSHLSLFDLPVGDGPLWSVSEREVETTSRDGREEQVVTVLPAWSAETKLDLGAPALGFSAAARVVADAFDMADRVFEARQTAVARSRAIGFEAAAVTGLVVALSAPVRRPGVCRQATVRFARPYAVVATACDVRPGRSAGATERLWPGLPIFSAWVGEPVDAEPLPMNRSRAGTGS